MSDERYDWLFRREPKRREVDAGAVVEHAHDLVHAGGTTNLSMRRLAASLHTSTSALYRIVPSKEWLFVAIVDRVFAEVEDRTQDRGDASPRDRIMVVSRSLHDVLAAHPHLHEILSSHVAVTPNTLRVAAEALTCLQGLGVGDDQLLRAYDAWSGYVIGFTLIEAKPPELAPSEQLQRIMRAQIEERAAELPIERPVVDAAQLGYGLSWLPRRLGDDGSSFEWGLAALLDGLTTRG